MPGAADQPPTEVERILKKIRKLLALSDSANEHEALLAMQKARQLRDSYDTLIRKQLTVTGLRTVMELRGIPCIPAVSVHATMQSIISPDHSASRSTARTISERR